jgi:hypothetical protein
MQIPITKIYPAKGHFRYQDACSRVKAGDLVWLVPEPENEFDPNAIQIQTEHREILGYIPADQNEELLRLLSSTHASYCGEVIRIESQEADEFQPIIKLYLAGQEEFLPFKQGAQVETDDSAEDFYEKNDKIRIAKSSPIKTFLLTLGIFFLIVIYIMLAAAKVI